MKNSFALGFLLGAICPALAYFFKFYTTVFHSFLPEKPITPFVIAAAINLIAMRFIYRSGREQTAKGVVLVTFLAMIVMIFVLKLKV